MENMPLEYSEYDTHNMVLYREIWRAIDSQPEIADCGAVTGPDHWLTLTGRVIFNHRGHPCPFNMACPYCLPGDTIWYNDRLVKVDAVGVSLKRGDWYWVMVISLLDKLAEL